MLSLGRFLAVLLVGFLSAPAAQAYEAAVVYNDCSNKQTQVMRDAMIRTDKSLTRLLAMFESGEIAPYVTAWFGSTPAPIVRQRYQHVRDMLDRPRTLVISCEERRCEHDVFGYAEGHAISVCPEFFASALSGGYDSQAGTLIHEFTHGFANTVDHAYGTHDARKLAAQNSKKAMENADSYQYLFEAATGDDVPYPTAPYEEENSCRWAYDGECDESGRGNGACTPGTDVSDCQAAHQDNSQKWPQPEPSRQSSRTSREKH